MDEQQQQPQQPQQPQQQPQDTGAGGDTGAKANASAGNVTVIHGANNQRFENLAGSSVQEVREVLAEVFNIPNDAQALVNGENVGNNYQLRPDDTLEFIRQAGVKGL